MDTHKGSERLYGAPKWVQKPGRIKDFFLVDFDPVFGFLDLARIYSRYGSGYNVFVITRVNGKDFLRDPVVKPTMEEAIAYVEEELGSVMKEGWQ